MIIGTLEAKSCGFKKIIELVTNKNLCTVNDEEIYKYLKLKFNIR